MQKRKTNSSPAAVTLAGRDGLHPTPDLYRVVFDTCGQFVFGEVASGSAIATDARALAYLLRIGAVVPIETSTGVDG